MTAPAETVDIAEKFSLARHGTLVAVGAEVADISSADAVPTATDPNAAALTPRAIYVGVTGDVKVDMADGLTAITFKNVPVGILPIAVSKIYKTGTGAASLLFLY